MEEGQWMSEEQYIRASLNTEEKEDNIFKSHDPFNRSWDVLKDYVEKRSIE